MLSLYPPGPALSLLIRQSEEDSRSATSIPTCYVELVELVIRQSRIPGAGLGLVLGAGGGLPCPPLMRGPLQQPPHQRQLLQAVADHVPGQAAGQVQAGSWQRSAENRQANLQVRRSCSKIPLQITEQKVRRQNAPSQRHFGTSLALGARQTDVQARTRTLAEGSQPSASKH